MWNETNDPVFTIIWKIKNFSYSCHDVNNKLYSPVVRIDSLRGTLWNLQLEIEETDSDEKYINIFLNKNYSENSPAGIVLGFDMSLLSTDGTFKYTEEVQRYWFKNDCDFGFEEFVDYDILLANEKSEFLPQDTLTIRCRIWKKNWEPGHAQQCVFLTKIASHRSSFIWIIRIFNLFSQKQKYIVTSLTKKNPLYTIFLFTKHDEIQVNIVNFSDKNPCRATCKISVLDSMGATVHFIEDEYIFSRNRETWQLPTLIKKSELMEQRDVFLPNDELVLHCECSASGGIECNRIEKSIYGPPSIHTTNLMMNCAKEHLFQIDNNREDIECTTSSKASHDLPANPAVEENKPLPIQLSGAPNLSSINDGFSDAFRNNLLSLYKEETLCDFTLKIGKENLRVHKVVLCARSPVFKAMLTTEMKETVNQLMEIHDLEVEIVRHMLNFMYTDTADDLNWETASKLYVAADKYDVAALKRLCSDALKTGLCVANIGDILILSDKHSDDDLKKSVQDFIYENDTEILNSPEWNTFMQKEVQLAAETMRLMYIKKAENTK